MSARQICDPTEAMRLPLREIAVRLREQKFLTPLAPYLHILAADLGYPSLYEKTEELRIETLRNFLDYLVVQQVTVQQFVQALFNCGLVDSANTVLKRTSKYMRKDAPPSFNE